ncbi:DUF4112 domain-containing protein [Patescibacteria group bacterium]|nr:DUF4112 domain-containing protein [Patescibacteria group bacterium]
MNTNGGNSHQGDEEELEVQNDGEVVDLAEEKAKRDELEHEVTEHGGPVGEEREEIEAICMMVDQHELDPAKREALKKEIMERLATARNSEQRVRIFATIADVCGVDAIIGFFVPEGGDVASAVASSAYLLAEANWSGMEWKGQAKILAYQVVDMTLGLVPVVGDVADVFFMANKLSESEFKKNTEKLVQEARDAGVPDEEIQEILERGETLRKTFNVAGKAVKIAQTVRGKGGEDVQEAVS